MKTLTKRKVRKTGVITTTLSDDLVRWLDATAKQRITTRRAVLEEALRGFRAQIARKSLADSFRRARGDKEMVFLADAGLIDWAEGVSSCEK